MVYGLLDVAYRGVLHVICTQRRSQQQQEAGAGGDGAVLGEAEGEGADALVERLGGAMDYTPGAAASSS